MCCRCFRNQLKFHHDDDVMPEGGGSLPELASRELSRKLLEGEAKLEQGSFEEAEVTLREALSINNEVCFLMFQDNLLIFQQFWHCYNFGWIVVHINPNSQSGAFVRPSLGHLNWGELCRRLEPYSEELSIERAISKVLYGFWKGSI
jgi:hypothetical protein